MKKTLVAILLLAALLMTCSVASADSWKPKTSVTIYCVSAAGGATDYTDRAMAQALKLYSASVPWAFLIRRLLLGT